MVLATQNPIEQEGTYPLPEAQMDRFLMKISVEYPDDKAELAIIRLLQQEEGSADQGLQKISQQHIFAAQEEIHRMAVGSPGGTVYCRPGCRHSLSASAMEKKLQQWIDIGSSPRASIALHRASRAQAWLAGRDYVDPDDVKSVLHAIMRHRLILTYDALADHVTADSVIDEIINQVAVG